jgi:hypothetical protein
VRFEGRLLPDTMVTGGGVADDRVVRVSFWVQLRFDREMTVTSSGCSP